MGDATTETTSEQRTAPQDAEAVVLVRDAKGAESRALTPPHQETELVLMPGLRLQAAQQLTRRFFAGGTLGLLLPISPNHYTFRDAQGARREAFQMASPSLALGVFVAFRLAEL